ncbi:MAG: alpha/beta fold hydrolase [Francisellaceae bacterium]
MTKRQFRKNRLLCAYHNEIKPRRKSLFFIHGLEGSAKNWQAQFRLFSDRYNILAYDLYGHGLSAKSKRENDYSITQSVLDAQSLIEYFHLENITVIAAGYGALISQLLVEIYSRKITRQLLINPKAYESRRGLPWYFYFPFSLSYRLLRSFKYHFNTTTNNALVWPRLLTLKAYMQALKMLPVIHVSDSKISVTTRILRSQSMFAERIRNIDHCYKVYYRAKIKSIDAVGRFPMVSAKEKVNYFLEQYIDELNITGFRNLVFEGAGVRGVAYSGVITALDSLGILKNIKRFSGTSSGAIYAIFLSIGLSAREIDNIVRHLDYQRFIDASGNFIANSARLITDYGWYRGNAFIEEMDRIIAAKLGNGDINFRELKARNGNELYIIGTNLGRGCAEIYSADHTPDMSIKEAVRISMSIPLYFKAVKRKENGDEAVLVDGGLIWNCPLELFDSPTFLHNPSNGLEYATNHGLVVVNMETLGFRLDPHQDPLAVLRKNGSASKVGNIFDFTRQFMKLVMLGQTKRHMEAWDWNRVVFVDTLEVSGTDFAIDQQGIDELIEQGKKGVYQHFAWRMSQNGVKFPQ